jgi:GDP-4-dehydro-6-deoxy-D-mannose reductase
MKVIVTGASGFVGKYLVQLLLQHNHTVIAIGINNSAFLKEMNVPIYKIDIVDATALKSCFKNEQPDAVVHLAAISNIPITWNKPELTIDINIHGTVNVLETLYQVNPKATLLNIGSGDEYGLAAKSGVPLTEDVLCQPQNPYSISKYCAEQLVLQLGKRYHMHVIHVRPFNHFGPGQARGFVTADFASQIAAIERGEQKPVIRVGDISASRDFTFVSDVVTAYVTLLEDDVPSGVYNICSGKARKIQDILDELISLSNKHIDIEIDPEKFRPSEVPFFVGNCDKLKNTIKWNPYHSFKEGMYEVLNYWRNIKAST